MIGIIFQALPGQTDTEALIYKMAYGLLDWASKGFTKHFTLK
jgi:hypothetical protein